MFEKFKAKMAVVSSSQQQPVPAPQPKPKLASPKPKAKEPVVVSSGQSVPVAVGSKRGRKPKFERPMTSSERSALSRARKRGEIE